MRVKATRKGLYDNELRDEGVEFDIPREVYNPTWMEPLDEDARDCAEEAAERTRQHRIDQTKAQIADLTARLKSLEKSSPAKKVKGEVDAL